MRPTGIRRMLRRPSFGLLMSLVVLNLLHPQAEGVRGGVQVLATLHLIVLAMAVRVVGKTRGERTGIWLFAVPTIALLLCAFVIDSPAIALANIAMLAVFYGYVITCLLSYVFRDTVVTVDELFAATCVYVLTAMLFACVYALQESLAPGSFSMPAGSGSGGVASYFDLLYFSFTVLTSTGFGDIHPLARQARAITVVEQVAGVMYVAILIARLTGMTPIRRPHDRDSQ